MSINKLWSVQPHEGDANVLKVWRDILSSKHVAHADMTPQHGREEEMSFLQFYRMLQDVSVTVLMCEAASKGLMTPEQGVTELGHLLSEYHLPFGDICDADHLHKLAQKGVRVTDEIHGLHKHVSVIIAGIYERHPSIKPGRVLPFRPKHGREGKAQLDTQDPALI